MLCLSFVETVTASLCKRPWRFAPALRLIDKATAPLLPADEVIPERLMHRLKRIRAEENRLVSGRVEILS